MSKSEMEPLEKKESQVVDRMQVPWLARFQAEAHERSNLCKENSACTRAGKYGPASSIGEDVRAKDRKDGKTERGSSVDCGAGLRRRAIQNCERQNLGLHLTSVLKPQPPVEIFCKRCLLVDNGPFITKLQKRLTSQSKLH
jgi:hypothetical protein